MEGRKPPVLLIPGKSGGGGVGRISGGGALYDIPYAFVIGGDMGMLDGEYDGAAGNVVGENEREEIPAEANPGRKIWFISSPCWGT